MKKRLNRSPEVAALLNPAFCGFLLSTAIAEYNKNVKEGVPYMFPFIMLPLVLHRPTRLIFPRTSKTAFSTWITNTDTAIAKVGFSERAKNMTPYVKEALIFSIQNKSIEFNDFGLLQSLSPLSKSFPDATTEVEDCIRASKFSGKWLAMIGDFKTAMALLGVRP